MSGRAERILIVVKRNDEGRLRSLQRRLLELDRHYGTRLDALLTRLDLLEDKRGGSEAGSNGSIINHKLIGKD